MVAGAEPHPLDALVDDPTGSPEMCGEEEFADVIDDMVAVEAPRLFAIVQEYGTRVDARIAAWGMAFGDRTEVIGVGGGVHLSQWPAETLVGRFEFGTHIKPRLVWVNRKAARLREGGSIL